MEISTPCGRDQMILGAVHVVEVGSIGITGILVRREVATKHQVVWMVGNRFGSIWNVRPCLYQNSIDIKFHSARCERHNQMVPCILADGNPRIPVVASTTMCNRCEWPVTVLDFKLISNPGVQPYEPVVTNF